MPNSYITDDQIIAYGNATEGDALTPEIFELYAESVSRSFDKECEVTDNFFAAAGPGVTTRTYRANGTRYLKLYPYIAGSIAVIDVTDDKDYYTATVADRLYREADNYIIFDTAPRIDTLISVTARYGFATVAADIQLAVIEQSLYAWRRKDPMFTEISGVASAVLGTAFSPTFAATTKRYRELYSANTFFA